MVTSTNGKRLGDGAAGERPGLPREPDLSEAGKAWADVREALSNAWFWLSLGWYDIVQRYRGSILGPFWLTLTSVVFIAGLGPLYAGLFGLDMAKYLPFMATGIIVWNLISSSINECCRVYIDNGDLMKQLRLPKTTHLLHALWRNLLIFAHSVPVIVGVMLLCQVPFGWHMLLVVPGLVLVVLNLAWIGMLVAIACLRFRDIQQIVGSVLLLGFFLSPVMWNPKVQSVNAWVVNLNPLAALLEVVRAPLLGEPISLPLVSLAIASLVVGGALTSVLFVRCRKQIVYWT